MRQGFVATVLALALMHPGMTSAADEHHHDAEPAAQLSLNQGQKWSADKHTADSAAAMKSIVEKAAGKPAEASLEEMHSIGKQLQEKLQTLIRGCTMTGPAHEQLHAWISVLAPEIEKLIQSDKMEAARGSFDRIVALLQSFDAHFESKPAP